MRYARAAAGLFGAVIIAALTWALPAQATARPVVTAITDVGCGTATVSVVLAEGVSGVYNARYYIDGEEAGKVPSTGTTLASKVLTFGEDTSGGEVDLYVAVIDGPESDYRPKTIAAEVDTDCEEPVATPTATAVPTVTAAPTATPTASAAPTVPPASGSGGGDTPSLPITGVSVGGIVAVAGLLLAAGIGFRWMARRRRTRYVA